MNYMSIIKSCKNYATGYQTLIISNQTENVKMSETVKHEIDSELSN